MDCLITLDTIYNGLEIFNCSILTIAIDQDQSTLKKNQKLQKSLKKHLGLLDFVGWNIN